MSIEKLEVFAKDGERHTRGLNQALGFPKAEKPERQWFNELFYRLTSGFNTIADSVNQSLLDLADAKNEIEAVKEKTIILESIADLSTIKNPKDGLRVYVKSYHKDTGVGGGYFIYNSSRVLENDGGSVLNGFVRVFGKSVDVTDFGATGKGQKLEHEPINSAIVYASTTASGIVTIPDGTYLVDGGLQGTKYSGEGGAIRILNNVHLKLSPRAIIKQVPTLTYSGNVIYFKEAKNASITGGTIVGERDEHVGTTGEWSYGIGVYSSENIHIERITIKNFWGDGININRSHNLHTAPTDLSQNKNIIIDSVICDNNRRQGMSLEHVIGCNVTKSIFKNTGGTLPSAGVDIEPPGSKYVRDVVFSQCTFANNAGSGLIVMNTGASRITAVDCVFDGNVSNEGQVSLIKCSQVTVRNSRLDPVGNTDARFVVTDCSDIFINDNHLKNGKIQIGDGARVSVIGNTLIRTEGTQYSYFNVFNKGKGCVDILFENNSTQSLGSVVSFGFELLEGNRVVIKNNKMSNMRSLGIVKSTEFEISGNHFSDVSILGFDFHGQGLVSNNIFNGMCFANNNEYINIFRETSDCIVLNNLFLRDEWGGSEYGNGLPGYHSRVFAGAKVLFYENQTTIGITGTSVNVVQIKPSIYRTLPTSNRPITASIGDFVYDSTLKIPIWWDGTKWINSTGVAV